MASKESIGHFEGPSFVDFLTTGRCQLNCVCFRPPETRSTEITLEQKKRVLESFRLVGTKGVGFSGGEPLLDKDLPELLKYAKLLGFRTTLSTNGLLFPQLHRDIMPYVDEIGIPIDGPTPEVNARMRPPFEANQFKAAVESIKIIIEDYPRVDLTVRTVVSALNFDSVREIPRSLEQRGVADFYGKIRWKLYQFNPAIPEQSLSGRVESLLLSTDDFFSVCRWVREDSVGRGQPVFLPIIAAEGNNFLVYPNGDAVTTQIIEPERSLVTGSVVPHSEYVVFGNVVSSFDDAMETWAKMRRKPGLTFGLD